ncbi:MAG: hypothetical protein L0H59_18505, partial [Tomitella sp.]|nr:hypothetical protein [Tomitella sp.]
VVGKVRDGGEIRVEIDVDSRLPAAPRPSEVIADPIPRAEMRLPVRFPAGAAAGSRQSRVSGD